MGVFVSSNPDIDITTGNALIRSLMCLWDNPVLTFWSLKPNVRTQVAGLYESPDSGGVFSCACAFVFLFISLPDLLRRFSLSNMLGDPFTVLLVLISIYYLDFIPQVKEGHQTRWPPFIHQILSTIPDFNVSSRKMSFRCSSNISFRGA